VYGDCDISVRGASASMGAQTTTAQKDDLAGVARAWLRQLLEGMHTLCFRMYRRISTPVSLSVAVCLPLQRRILTGSFVLSESQRAEYYDAARRMRQLIALEFKKCFDAGVSVLVFALLNVLTGALLKFSDTCLHYGRVVAV
jgi:hypothetical protein